MKKRYVKLIFILFVLPLQFSYKKILYICLLFQYIKYQVIIIYNFVNAVLSEKGMLNRFAIYIEVYSWRFFAINFTRFAYFVYDCNAYLTVACIERLCNRVIM